MWNFNWWALIIAAVASFGLGSLWYSPLLFGKSWLEEMGLTEKSKQMGGMSKGKMAKIFGANFVLDLCTAFALWNIGTPLCLSWTCLNIFALVAWFGFMLPILVGSVLWEGKSWSLLAINASYRLVALFLMAAILAQFAF